MCNFDCYIVHTLLIAKDALRAIFFRKSSWFYFYGWRVDVSPWIDIWRFSVSCIIGHLHFVIPSGEIFACFTNFCANFLCEEDTVFENQWKGLIFSTFIIWISRQNSASENFNQLKTHCYKMYFWCHFWRENSNEIIFEWFSNRGEL